MKVLIVTVGTRGDVQPYVGLSQKLMSAGHSVTIASSRAHQALIEDFHIVFHCIDETQDTSLIQEVVRRRGVRAINEGVRLLFDGMLKCHEKILEAVDDVDLVIGHGWLGESESEMCHKRFIRVGISPNIAEKLKSQAASIPEKLRIDIEKFALNRMIIRPYNDFLRKINYRTTDLKTVYAKPLFLPISKVLLDSTKLWNKRTYQSAYWYTEYGSYSLPNDVVELLSNDRRTVLVNFGSMTSGLKVDNSYVRVIYQLATEMDCNLIWIGPHAFGDEYLGSERFVAVQEIPLGHILPKVNVALHHCGLGTTSEVIRSGCPSVPVPFVLDQYDWAKRLISTGAATEAIRPDELTESNIRRRLKSVFDNEEFRSNARFTRQKVLEEIETDETVERIERLCES